MVSNFGFRNKSGRNSIVPVPSFVKLHLHPKGLDDNLFTGEQNSRNPDYFKTLWSRYKKQTKLLKQDKQKRKIIKHRPS